MTETVTLPVLWVGVMAPNNGRDFEVRVLAEFGEDKLIILTDDNQLWCMSRRVVSRTDVAQPTGTKG